MDDDEEVKTIEAGCKCGVRRRPGAPTAMCTSVSMPFAVGFTRGSSPRARVPPVCLHLRAHPLRSSILSGFFTEVHKLEVKQLEVNSSACSFFFFFVVLVVNDDEADDRMYLLRAAFKKNE